MPEFNFQPTPVPLNPLMSAQDLQMQANKVQSGQLINQGVVQDLTDRATLRGLAPGLASGDPTAGATALTLGQPGVEAASGLAAMHNDARQSLANTLDVTGAVSGAILASPPEQRKALWDQFRPTLLAAGAKQTPPDYPGDDYLNAHRAAATTVAQQLQLLGNVPTTDPTRTPLSLQPGAKVGPGGVIMGGQQQGGYGAQGQGASAAPDSYVAAVEQSESGGDPTIKNTAGSSAGGLGQFTDSTWLNTLKQARPDLAQGRSDQQLLAMKSDGSPGGQALQSQMVQALAGQNAPILQQAGLPVNPTTLYLAHGFGAGGAVKLLKSDPGTPMESLYPPTVMANGQQAMNPVMAQNPQYRGKTAGQVVATFGSKMAGVGGAQPAPQQQAVAPQQPKPVQTASLTGATGMPQTANDASGDPGDAPAASSPTDRPASVADALARARAGTPAPPAVAPIQNPNALLSAAPPGAMAAPPRNALLPQPATAPAAAPQVAPPTQRNALMPPTQAAPQQPAQSAGAAGMPGTPPPGTVPQYVGGKWVPSNTPGYIIGVTPDHQLTQMRAPGAPPKLKQIEAEGQIINVDENTGQPVGPPIPIPSKGRITFVDTPQGRQATQDGKPVGDVIPFSGRPEQKAAYDADRETTRDLIQNSTQADTNIMRLNETADIAKELATGSTASARAKAAAYIQTTLGDSAASKWLKDTVGMPDPAAAQIFTKLGITAAGSAAKGDLGANNGIQATQLYQAANPNLELLPDANKRLINQQRVVAQASKDYATATLDAFEPQEASLHAGGPYKPLTSFNRQWAEQNNPQVYAAAMGILNGDSFDKWSARVSPEQGQRAAQIVARIDPKAMVPGRGGEIPAASFLPQPATRKNSPQRAAAPVQQAAPPAAEPPVDGDWVNFPRDEGTYDPRAAP